MPQSIGSAIEEVYFKFQALPVDPHFFPVGSPTSLKIQGRPSPSSGADLSIFDSDGEEGENIEMTDNEEDEEDEDEDKRLDDFISDDESSDGFSDEDSFPDDSTTDDDEDGDERADILGRLLNLLPAPPLTSPGKRALPLTDQERQMEHASKKVC